MSKKLDFVEGSVSVVVKIPKELHGHLNNVAERYSISMAALNRYILAEFARQTGNYRVPLAILKKIRSPTQEEIEAEQARTSGEIDSEPEEPFKI